MSAAKPARAVRVISLTVVTISSAAIVFLALLAVRIDQVLAEHAALLARLQDGAGHLPAALGETIAQGRSLIAVAGVVLVPLAVGALAMPGVVRAVLRAMDGQRSQAAAIARNELRLRAIVDAAPDAIVMVDAAGRVRFWNRGAERLFGHTVGAACGMHVGALFAAPKYDDCAQASGALAGPEAICAPSGGKRRDAIVQRADGTTFRAEFSIASCLEDASVCAVWLIRDVTAEHRAAERLRELARTDSLTGLINRREFMAVATEEVARALRYRRPLSLLWIDIDNFKTVNDTFGHAAGDEVLRHFAGALRHGLRSHDTAARVGGEEFAALLPETSGAAALLLARRLNRMVARNSAPCGSRHVSYTISIGVAELGCGGVTPTGSAHATAERMLLDAIARADAALYAAKAQGRDRSVREGRPAPADARGYPALSVSASNQER